MTLWHKRAVKRIQFSIYKGHGLRLLLILALFLPALNTAVGRVLCIGDDGHVEIESVGPHGDCVELTGSPRPVPTFPGHHCGDCLDVSVSFDEATRSSHKLLTTDTALSIQSDSVLLSRLDGDTSSVTSFHITASPRIPSYQKIVLII